jgi:hypothetical protein
MYSCTYRAREGSTGGENLRVSITPDVYIGQVIFGRVDETIVDFDCIGIALVSISFHCRISDPPHHHDDHRIRIRPLLPQRLPET